MNVSGSIATNKRASVDDVKKLCENRNIEFYSENGAFYIKTYDITFVQQLVVQVELTETEVKYKTFIPELSGYIFLTLVALGILYRIVGIGLWSVVLLITIGVLTGIRVRYDKLLFQLMDRLIPANIRLIPEKAGPEHVSWINDSKLCPACGTPRNEYSAKCHSCGLTLQKGKTDKKVVNHNHTGAGIVDIKYDYTSE